MLFEGGCRIPHEPGAFLAFESQVLQLQMALEDAFTSQAQSALSLPSAAAASISVTPSSCSSCPSVILLHDRGLCDVAAYVSYEQYRDLLRAKGTTPEQALARYDIVLHMTSLAVDKPEAFLATRPPPPHLSSSRAISRAADLDSRILQSYSSHPCRFICGTFSSFPEKVEHAASLILQSLDALSLRRQQLQSQEL